MAKASGSANRGIYSVVVYVVLSVKASSPMPRSRSGSFSSDLPPLPQTKSGTNNSFPELPAQSAQSTAVQGVPPGLGNKAPTSRTPKSSKAASSEDDDFQQGEWLKPRTRNGKKCCNMPFLGVFYMTRLFL